MPGTSAAQSLSHSLSRAPPEVSLARAGVAVGRCVRCASFSTGTYYVLRSTTYYVHLQYRYESTVERRSERTEAVGRIS